MTPIPPFVPQAAGDRTFTAKHVLVLQTFVVQSLDGQYHYEIHVGPDTEPGAARTILLTKDETAYAFALAIEGKAARCDASWHYGRRGGQRIAVLDTLEVGA